MRTFYYAVLLAAAWGLSGCGKEKIAGSYRDAENPAITYELREDGAWVAQMAVGAPSGVFPHGSDRRLEGTYRRSGEELELVCNAVRRQDPTTGEFADEPGDPSACNHRLRAEKDKLLPVGTSGETNAVFASDLNPLGARVLVRVGY